MQQAAEKTAKSPRLANLAAGGKTDRQARAGGASEKNGVARLRCHSRGGREYGSGEKR
jgi:hypothetical protein